MAGTLTNRVGLSDDWYPQAVRRQLMLRDDAGNLVTAETLSGRFLSRPLGWILHVVDGNNDPYTVFRDARKPNRRFSNFWVAKNGTVVQYVPATAKSWAQGAGNPTYWSVETEGFPGEPLTERQLDALAALHVWLRVDDARAGLPGQRGIGTHGMGGGPWGNHPGCPGTTRAGQRIEIIRRAQALRAGHHTQEDDMPSAREVADAILDTPVPTGELGSDGHPLTFRWAFVRTMQAAQRAEAAAEAAQAELARRAGGAS